MQKSKPMSVHLLGYLVTLENSSLPQNERRLNITERMIGQENKLGSLMNLGEQLEKMPSLAEVYQKLKTREKLNAQVPANDKELQQQTTELYTMLIELLRNKLDDSTFNL